MTFFIILGEMSGLYIHIPFCASRCIYCAFYSTTRHELKDRYVDALCREMAMRRNDGESPHPRTLYIGGGTPSQLSALQIHRILDNADSVFGLSGIEEATIECNPDDINGEFLSGIRDTAINRISIGIQSLDDGILELIHRRHTAAEALYAIELCKSAGFSNISADLIYGLPGQTCDSFQRDLQTLADLGTPHISAYCLSYEEGTPLHRMLADGRIHQAPDDVCADMYTILCNTLKDNGYWHYEISNFCRPGYRSQHNSSYWNRTEYIGLGAAAHSFDGIIRRWNISDIDKYITGILSGNPSFGQERLTDSDRYNETLMLSLRTSDGLSINDIQHDFGKDAVGRLLSSAAEWIESGDLILSDDGRMRLTESGLFRSDGIVSSMFID